MRLQEAKMKKIAVLTSGGDAPGMNAAVRAVVRSAISRGYDVYGILRGYEGLIENDICRMDWNSVSEVIYKGGTVLRTARCERFYKDEWVKLAAENFNENGFHGLVAIGGDGTFRGAQSLAAYGVPIVGVPASIDNDFGYTDYTIGFDTAVNTVLDLVSKIRDTSSSHERCTVIEVMGRHCGDLALHAGLAGGADFVLLPEQEFDIDEMISSIRQLKHNGKLHNIIVKAEGFEMPSQELAQLIEERTGSETRVVVPGYIQRGGSPSFQDRLFASLAGAKAVELLDAGKGTNGGMAVGIDGNDIICVPLKEAIETPSVFNKEMYELSKVLK